MIKRHFLALAIAAACAIVVGSWLFTREYIARYRSEKKYHESIKNLSQDANIVPIAIIGSGCAGLSAAIYGARSHYYTVVFEGQKPGGQLTTTSWVENWPSAEKILGKDLINKLKGQAASFGAQIVSETVTHIDTASWPFTLTTEDGHTIKALTVIIATGANPKKLGVPGEESFWGKGVTTCAICDAPFYKECDVVVVGGGDSALEEALQLAAYAKKITVLVRGPKLRASAAMQERLKEYSHIDVWYNTSITEIKGDDHHVQSIAIKRDGAAQEIPIDGVFLAIGHDPNTQFVKGLLKTNANGYLQLSSETQQTSERGIFAAGDVADHRYRQAGVAAGDGIKAALDAADFLREIGFNDVYAQALKNNYYIPQEIFPRLQLESITTLKEFDTFIIRDDHKPVIFDFYTDFCPSCLQMLPLVEMVAAQLKDKAVFVKINALNARPIAEKYVVPTVPTLLVFKDGKLIARSKDVMNRQELVEFVQQFIG